MGRPHPCRSIAHAHVEMVMTRSYRSLAHAHDGMVMTRLCGSPLLVEDGIGTKKENSDHHSW